MITCVRQTRRHPLFLPRQPKDNAGNTCSSRIRSCSHRSYRQKRVCLCTFEVQNFSRCQGINTSNMCVSDKGITMYPAGGQRTGVSSQAGTTLRVCELVHFVDSASCMCLVGNCGVCDRIIAAYLARRRLEGAKLRTVLRGATLRPCRVP